MLRDVQKRNKALRMEMDELKQQLCDAYEDMEVSNLFSFGLLICLLLRS